MHGALADLSRLEHIRISFPDHHLSTQSIAGGSSLLAATLWSQGGV